MYKLPSTLTEDIAYFGSLIDDFNHGKIEPIKFKGNRVPMGIYEQRKDGTYMVRIRCTGGFITPAQLSQVALTAISHQSEMLHITTRQEIQIHHILIDQVKTILPELQQVELSSKGGGGNTVRNILVDVYSGISTDEAFDVLPYASALTTHLIAETDSFTLPRKLKIAFSTSESRLDFGIINDLGFVAKIKNGKKGFKVYIGGSVASNPTLGWEIFDFAPAEDVLNIALAAKRFFNHHGNRKNKHKARIRYIFYKDGEEKAKELFFNYYNEIKANENTVFVPDSEVAHTRIPALPRVNIDTPAYETWKANYVQPQRQQGFNSVTVSFENGNTTPDIILQIAEFIAPFGDDSIRFTARQQIQLRHISDQHLPNVYQFLQSIGVNTSQSRVASNVVSCTGADTCRLGICLSKGAASALRRQLDKSTLPLSEVKDFEINISGCPNSCAQQLWADLGFHGRVGRNERMYPAYSVYVGAQKGAHPQLAEQVGVVSAQDLPAFTESLLAKYIDKKSKFENFNDYLQASGKQDIEALLETYKSVPSFAENKNYYYDWGAEELFSVANKGPAECSAGLFDMIDVDLKNINDAQVKLETATENTAINSLLYDIIFSASRMLLVTRGAEARTTAENFELFESKFINEGLVDAKFRSIVLKAKTGNASTDYLSEKELILELGKTVITLYENMDDSLQFKNVTTTPVATAITPSAPAESTRVKDFRGVACPMNFVKTKIELSTLQVGDLLEVWLDDGAPIQNVPGSVRNEGHTIISTTPTDDYWKVLIRKA
jgi:sulfite reductase (ferredoxin)